MNLETMRGLHLRRGHKVKRRVGEKRIKQIPYPKLFKQASVVFSRHIRKLYPYCVTCESTQNLTCGHLIRRGKKSVHFDEYNNFTQCAPCNLKHEWWPHVYTNWFLHKFGQKQYDLLCQRAAFTIKPTREFLEKIIRDYGA